MSRARARGGVVGEWRTRRGALASQPAPVQVVGGAAPPWGSYFVEPGMPGSPLSGVQWSLILAGFMAYVGVIVTYKFPIGDVTMAVALVGLFIQRDRLRTPPYIILFGLFVAWTAIGALQSPYPQIAFDQLTDTVKVFLVALVAANALRTRPQLRLFAVFFLGCFALFPVRGVLFNYFISNYTLAGRAIWNYIYENPNDLAALTLLQFSMAAGLAATEPRGWVRLAARTGIVVLPLVILLTQSRGAFLALAAMIAVMIATHRGRRVRLIVSILIVSAIVATMIPASAWQRFQGLTRATSTSTLSEVDREGSAKDRYAVWTVAFRMIADRPILGVGAGAYPYAHNDYTLNSTDLSAGARGYRDTHSTYFNLAAESGIPGLLLFLGMVVTTLRHAQRARRTRAAQFPKLTAQILYLQLGLFAYLVAGIFGSFAKLSFVYLHIALIWALAEECLSTPATPALLPTGGGTVGRDGRRTAIGVSTLA